MMIHLCIKSFTVLVGCVFNTALIYVTYKQKNLHGTCNILICLNAFSNLLFHTGCSIWPILLISGIRLIRVSLCFYLQTLSLIGTSSNIANLLFIASDRLFRISNSRIYATINKTAYLGTIVVFVASYSLLTCILAYKTMLLNPEKKVTCTIEDCGSPEIQKFVLFINFCCCLCYFVMWIILKTSLWNKQGKDKKTQRLFKSLVVILVVSVMPYVVYIVLTNFFAYIELSPLELWYAYSVVGYGIIFASSADILILYMFSTDYRAAIKHQLFKKPSTMSLIFTHPKSALSKF